VFDDVTYQQTLVEYLKEMLAIQSNHSKPPKRSKEESKTYD